MAVSLNSLSVDDIRTIFPDETRSLETSVDQISTGQLNKDLIPLFQGAIAQKQKNGFAQYSTEMKVQTLYAWFAQEHIVNPAIGSAEYKRLAELLTSTLQSPGSIPDLLQQLIKDRFELLNSMFLKAAISVALT
jgi:hypothetical protein